MQAEGAAAALLSAADTASRLAGIEVIRTRGIVRLKPALMRLIRDEAGELRRAAAKAMQDLDFRRLWITRINAATRAQGDTRAVEAAIKALRSVSAGQQPVVLRVLGVLGGSTALDEVRARLDAPEQDVRAAAFDVLCEWPGSEALPVLLQLARDEARTVRCVRSVLRIAAAPEVPPAQKVDICRQVLPMIRRAEERKVLLGLLSGLAEAPAMELAAGFLSDPEVKAEAALAVVTIGERLPAEVRAQPAVKSALQQVAAANISDDLTQRARHLLEP